MTSRLIVPLDYPELPTALEIADRLCTAVDWFKIGKELFTSVGPPSVQSLKETGKSVFLDLKFHDIPNTVSGAVASATKRGADMINVHAIGGLEMMQAASQSAMDQADKLNIAKPKLLAVTVLTSIDQLAFARDLDSSRSLSAQVVYLAKLAQQAGLDGVVASPLEIEKIRRACGNDFWIVTPGIRPSHSAISDQKRIMSPAEAIDAGADQLVIGRPITKSNDPLKATHEILTEMGSPQKLVSQTE